MNQQQGWEVFLKSFQSMTDQEKEQSLAAMPPEQRKHFETLLAAQDVSVQSTGEQTGIATLSHESDPSPLAPAPPIERYFAYLLELFPLIALIFIPVLGGLLTTAYILFRDALFDGQSVGKKLLKLRVVTLTGQRAAGPRESALRNFPLAIGFFLPVIPVVGHILGGIFSSIVFIVEAILISVNKDHRRMGDKLANTIVVREADVTGPYRGAIS